MDSQSGSSKKSHGTDRARVDFTDLNCQDGHMNKVLYIRSRGVLRCVPEKKVSQLLMNAKTGMLSPHRTTQFIHRNKHYEILLALDAQRLQRKGNHLPSVPILRSFVHAPAQKLNPIISRCPFIKWGMNIVGSTITDEHSRRFFLLASDYFLKWIEGEV